MKNYCKILIIVSSFNLLNSCDLLRDDEDGNLIIAVDNTKNEYNSFSVYVDGSMKGSLNIVPLIRSIGLVNCGDDWVEISQTQNVSVITGVSGGKRKIELKNANGKVVTTWDIKMDGCTKVSLVN